VSVTVAFTDQELRISVIRSSRALASAVATLSSGTFTNARPRNAARRRASLISRQGASGSGASAERPIGSGDPIPASLQARPDSFFGNRHVESGRDATAADKIAPVSS
jgi:hypothetical protein